MHFNLSLQIDFVAHFDVSTNFELICFYRYQYSLRIYTLTNTDMNLHIHTDTNNIIGTATVNFSNITNTYT